MHVLVWQVTVYDLEFEGASLRDQVTREQFQEEVDIVTMTVSGSKLNATMQNDGESFVHLIGVWITEYQNPPTPAWHRRFQLNQRVNPGRLASNIGQELTQALSSSYNYVVKFVTAKGNIIAGIYSPIGQLGRTGVSTTGYLFFTFSQDSFKLTNQTQFLPVPAWVISPGSQTFVWYVQVSNHGIYNLTLYKYSVLSFIKVEKSTSVGQNLFYIVKNTTANPTPNEVVAYPDLSQTIPANPNGDYDTGGTLQWVFFSASQVDPGPSHVVYNWGPGTQEQYIIWMIFYYRYGTEDLTQIIPFAGVHVI